MAGVPPGVRRAYTVPLAGPRGGLRAAVGADAAQRPAAFRNFSATELFCPKCRTARPVREKLLLVLPDGDLYDYLCTQCGTSLGSRKG